MVQAIYPNSGKGWFIIINIIIIDFNMIIIINTTTLFNIIIPKVYNNMTKASVAFV